MHVKEFSIELQIANISPVTLLKRDSTTDALPANLTILRTLTKTFGVESVFILVLGVRLESCNYLKLTLLKMFSW